MTSAIKAGRFLPPFVRDTSVRFMTPRYTMGAMVRIDDADGNVLLVKPAYRKQWTLPGGVAGRNENPLEVMQRELYEETTLRCEVIGVPVVMMSAESRIIDFIYRARLAEGLHPSDARPSSVEIERVGWFPPADVPRLAGSFAHKVIADAGAAGEDARLVFVDRDGNWRFDER